MSNSTRIAERQPTDTSSPMPVDAVRDLLAAVRALEARVAVLEGLLASAIMQPFGLYETDPGFHAYAKAVRTPSDALSAALRLPTVPDAFGRI